MTLQRRLTILAAGLVFLALLSFAAVAGSLLWQSGIQSAAQQIDAQADALTTVALTNPADLDTTGTDLLLENGLSASAEIFRGGQLLWTGGVRRETSPLPADYVGGHLLTRQQDLLTVIQSEGGVTVQVSQSLLPLKTVMTRYTVAAVLTLSLLSVLAAAVVSWQVRRTLRPLYALVGRVQQLESSQPVPGTAVPGEVGTLARALDASLHALHEQRERETLFLASASHELRTPVTAMLTDVQHTLSRERTPQELRATLERTERAAGRLRSLTGNLMNLTRAQRSLPALLHPSDLDLLELAGEAVDLLQPLSVQRRTDLWLDGTPTPLRGDSGLLSALLENLIGNALKFTPEGGEVQVHSRPEGDWAVLTVQDSGPGFPPGALTEVFVRGQGTKAEGFGLGLAVVSEVVAAHGGQLELGRSGLGGAQVTVRLPREVQASNGPTVK